MKDTKKQNDNILYLPFLEVCGYENDVFSNRAIFDESRLKRFITAKIPNSLDQMKLYECLDKYKRSKKKPKIEYTDYLLINIIFGSNKRKDDKNKGLDYRKYLYENGFYLNGQHYVRYKRTSGSSRDGRCLFIIEQLFDEMEKWTECEVEFNPERHNLSSYEAYKALTLSGIQKCISIPLDHILFVKDRKVSFYDTVIDVKRKNEDLLQSDVKESLIENNIFDGEGLLDESVFEKNDYLDAHMLLLRNRFFKACCFRTKLKRWFYDNDITSIEQLKNMFSETNDEDKKHKKKTGIVTFAKNIDDIDLVVSESCLKFLKFYDGFSEKSIRKWCNIVDESFGVVKTDKAPKFCFGKQVTSSYQLLNTINLQKEEVEELYYPYIDAIYHSRMDPIFFSQFISGFMYSKKKENEEPSESEDEIENEYQIKGNLVMELMRINSGFSNADFYYDFQDSAIKVVKERARSGKCYLTGTNATLFGNGPEYLKYIIGKWDGESSVLDNNSIRTYRFSQDGQRLLCVRYPHITMGNVYLPKNDLSDDPIWDYFDIGEHIVHVNAVNENIQQRLNGCDYDSDTMFIIDNPILVSQAERQENLFYVPVSRIDIPTDKKRIDDLAELDDTNEKSGKMIGQIVDLSQVLNSILWDKINRREPSMYLTDEEIDIYKDIAILAVLSGIEIDRAKRDYGIDTREVVKEIKKKYKEYKYPQFFSLIQESYPKSKLVEEPYKTTMEYVRTVDLKRKKNGKRDKHKIVEYIREDIECTETDRKRAKQFLTEYNLIVNKYLDKEKQLRSELKQSYEDKKGNKDRTAFYKFEELMKKNKSDEKAAISECISRCDVLTPSRLKTIFVLAEKGKDRRGFYWNLYYPLLKELIETSKSRDVLETIFIMDNGHLYRYELTDDDCGLKYFDFYLKEAELQRRRKR